MIRQYASRGLELAGLVVVGESLLIHFGDMGPMMYTATAGVGIFFAGYLLAPRKP